MALSLENALLVRQKVKSALMDANPGIQEQFKDLFQYLSTQGKNPDLQFVAFAGASADDAGGVVLADAATKLYAAYGKKTATATDSYLHFLDDATDDAGLATDGRLLIPFLIASEQACAFYATGLTMATGVVAKTYTDWDGTTDSAAGDSPNGFIIIGAA